MNSWIKRTLLPEDWDIALIKMMRAVRNNPRLLQLDWHDVAEIAGVWA